MNAFHAIAKQVESDLKLAELYAAAGMKQFAYDHLNAANRGIANLTNLHA